MHRQIVHIDADIFGAQRGENTRSIRRDARAVQLDHIEVIRMVDLGIDLQGAQPRQARHRKIVAPRDGAAALDPARQFFNLTQAQRGLDVVHPIIVTQLDHRIVPRA